MTGANAGEGGSAQGPLVIKLGGELVSEARAAELEAIVASLKALRADGQPIILVHGGGPQTSALQRKLGQTPNMVGGRRVTDGPTLEAIKMVVGGQVNIDLVSALRGGGVPAVGLNGVSGGIIQCVRRPAMVVSGGGDEPVDYGFVGRITGVDRTVLDALLGAGFTPVLACIGGDLQGVAYNINADTVANAVARALGARALVLLTSTPGVLRDKDDPSTRLAQLSIAEGRSAIADRTVQGGMIPKLEESFATLEAGVGRVLILGHLTAGQLEEALEQPGRWGTSLTA